MELEVDLTVVGGMGKGFQISSGVDERGEEALYT